MTDEKIKSKFGVTTEREQQPKSGSMFLFISMNSLTDPSPENFNSMIQSAHETGDSMTVARATAWTQETNKSRDVLKAGPKPSFTPGNKVGF